MNNFKDLVKQFNGVVHIQDIQNEFDRLVNGINSIVDSINDINDLKDHDYSVGGATLSSANYTLTLGALKSVLGVYDDNFVVRPPIVKCPGNNNYYKAFPGLYCDKSIGIIQTKDNRLDAGVITTTEEKEISTYLTVEEDNEGYVFSQSYTHPNYGNTTTSVFRQDGENLLRVAITTPSTGYYPVDYTISAKYTPIIACGDLQVGDIIYFKDGFTGDYLRVEPLLSFYDTSNSKTFHEPIALIQYGGRILTFEYGSSNRNSTGITYLASSQIGSYNPIIASRYTVTNITSSTITLHLEQVFSGITYEDGGNFTIPIPEGYRCNTIFLSVTTSDIYGPNVVAGSGLSFGKDLCYLMRGSTRYDFITGDTTLKNSTASSTVVNPKLDKGILLNKQTGEISLSETIDDSTIDSIACSKVGTSEMNQNAIANITISNETRAIPSTIPTLKITPTVFSVWNDGGGHDTVSGPCFRIPKGGARAATCIISWLGKVIWGLRYNSNSDRKHKAAWSYNPIWQPSGISSTFTKEGNGTMHDKVLKFKWVNK